MLRFSAVCGILTGLTLAVMEVRANWGGWQWWPWWLVDFVSAALLLAGGIATLSNRDNGRAWLVAGWAFTLGMAWMSLAGNIEAGVDADRDARLGGAYILLVGSLVASALFCLMLALFGRDDQSKV